ncbi:MAG TPA: DsbE family thiol:disulfide interchange protein [Gammaproteobacteria bacterium]|nr:DsbE family thiol:disulfide interchange protein [Gammaproteobacteria bacterium]
MKARFLIPLVLFLLLIGLFVVGLKLDPREVPSPLIDKPAPEFSLPELLDKEKTISTADLTKSKVSLFNVWASWCVACRQEHPFLVELARAGEVPIYGLNYKDKRPDAIRWLNRLGNPYTASAFDEKGRVGIDWGVYGVPETFVVDSKGIIRYKQIGPLTEQAWRETILPLIEKIKAEEG